VESLGVPAISRQEANHRRMSVSSGRIARDTEHDDTNFVLHRGEHAFVVLNLYPYISGHLMVVPYLHTSEFDRRRKRSRMR
jgi:ATP adenylyltransferase